MNLTEGAPWVLASHLALLIKLKQLGDTDRRLPVGITIAMVHADGEPDAPGRAGIRRSCRPSPAVSS